VGREGCQERSGKPSACPGDVARSNDEVAALLGEYADLISITGGDAFRARVEVHRPEGPRVLRQRQRVRRGGAAGEDPGRGAPADRHPHARPQDGDGRLRGAGHLLGRGTRRRHPPGAAARPQGLRPEDPAHPHRPHRRARPAGGEGRGGRPARLRLLRDHRPRTRHGHAAHDRRADAGPARRGTGARRHVPHERPTRVFSAPADVVGGGVGAGAGAASGRSGWRAPLGCLPTTWPAPVQGGS